MSLPVPDSVPLGITNVHDEAGNPPQQAVNVTMISPETSPVVEYEFLLKLIAIGSNIALQLSPLRLMMEIQVAKSVGDFSAFPLVALTACGFQWSFYGYFAYSVSQNAGFLMLVYANVLGLVLGVYYLTVYAHNASKTSTAITNQLLVLFVLFAAEVTYCEARGEDNLAPRLWLSGVMSAILSILVSASPMVAIPKIWQLQSTKTCLPTDMVVASLMSSVLWLWCGYLLGDPWVWMPNLCGVVVGSVQVAIILYFQIAWKNHLRSCQTWGSQVLQKISSFFEPRKPSTGETD